MPKQVILTPFQLLESGTIISLLDNEMIDWLTVLSRYHLRFLHFRCMQTVKSLLLLLHVHGDMQWHCASPLEHLRGQMHLN